MSYTRHVRYFELTTGNFTDDADAGLAAMLDVDTSADTDVKQDDKGGSQGGDEEVQLGAVRLLLGHSAAEDTDGVKQDQSGETNGGIELGATQVLEGVDNDTVGRLTGVDTLDAHELGDLTSNNVDTRTSHESANRRQRDELNEPAESGETEEGDNCTNNDSQGRGDNMSLNLR